MDYSSQKKFFQTSYATGSDHWTSLPFALKGGELIQSLQPGAMILDIGSGRGRFPFELAKDGFKVIGLDNISALIEKNNQEVKNFKLESKIRFIEGDIFDIPLSDSSFDAVADIGLLHHIHPEDWSEYRNEIIRVLKPGAYFFLITLSKNTTAFLDWKPKQNVFGDFSHDGVFYHFFTTEELNVLFESDFDILSERTETVTIHNDQASYIVSLMRKK
jgi:ubiquinone/menaquinone biosynthesis C-methylase UbiE